MGCRKNHLTFVLLFWGSFIDLGLCLPSEFSIIGYDSAEFVSEERVVELFGQWREKHGKVYKHADEVERRLENFWKNLRYVMEKNSKRRSAAGHVVGLNSFADMSNAEFREVYLSKMKKPERKKGMTWMNREEEEVICKAPSSLDWRKKGVVTAVKNQKQCGSCWAFSSTGAMEGINAIVTGDLISLSEQELVDCDSTNKGCEGGNMDYAFEWVVNNGGIDTESDYPYIAADGTCNTTKERNKKVVTIDGYEDVARKESALLCAVVQQPISVGIDGSAEDFQLYTGGIYDGDCSSNPSNIDHAVLIVGYGSQDGEDYWIAKNSWGTSWGMEGYIYIRRNTDLKYGVCAINDMASYPTKQSLGPSPFPSPSVPPPPPPPAPSPSQCGDFSYCPATETCCCLVEVLDECIAYGCCAYENAVCCAGTVYCCPHDYPICDIEDGLCLQKYGDTLGVPAKKRKIAKHKFPWTKLEETANPHQPLQWKRNQFDALR